MCLSRSFCPLCSNSYRCACHGSSVCSALRTGVLVTVLLSAFLFFQVCLSWFFYLLSSLYRCACHGSFVCFALRIGVLVTVLLSYLFYVQLCLSTIIVALSPSFLCLLLRTGVLVMDLFVCFVLRTVTQCACRSQLCVASSSSSSSSCCSFTCIVVLGSESFQALNDDNLF